MLHRLLLGCLLLFAAPLGATPALNVFAAASLQGALDEVVTAWRAQGGAPVQVSYAGSPALARQIEQDAPADVFFSADLDWMNYLHVRGRIDPDSRRNVLGNRLVLIAPADAGVPPFAFDLQAPLPRPLPLPEGGHLALALTDSVPAGKYAKAALNRLRLWDAVADRAAEVENVRAALQLVARGEAPLGVVYASDAAVEPKVKVVATFPFGSHPRIVYPVARVAASSHPEAARFIAFLAGETASALFRKQHFEPID